MSRKKVIVKRLNAIQNLGAMDVLCTDKTGTLTLDQIILETALRRRARRRTTGVLGAGLPQQPLPDGPQERPRPRRPRARGDRTSSSRPRLRQGRRDPVRLRAADHVGRRPHAEGKDRLICQGRARRQIFERCDASSSTASVLPDGATLHHRGPEGGVRAAERRRLPRAGARLPATSSRATAPTPAKTTSAT